MTDYRLVPSCDENGGETGFYTREPDGVSGMTVSALADLCGAAQSTVSQFCDRLRDADPITNNLSERLKPFAGKDLRLITNDPQGRLLIPDEACWAILGYYAREARQFAGKRVAEDNYDRIGGAGMRLYIWGQTGFVPEVLRPQIRITTSVYIQRLENIRDHSVSDDMWTTFREGAEVLLLVEKEMQVPVDQMDLCDGSIGRRWSDYRKGKPWVEPVGSYTHVFRDHRPDAVCKAYDLSELRYFRPWLRDIYVPELLPFYLADKYGKLACREIYNNLGDLSDAVLQATEIKKMTSAQQAKYDNFKKLQAKLLGGQLQPGDLEELDAIDG